MKLEISNRQKHHRLRLTQIRKIAAQLFSMAQRREPLTRWGTITLVLTDDAEIADIKLAVFGYREVTDVVTLRYAPSPIDPGIEAELFINVQRAFSRPCRKGWSPLRELSLYIAHGFDHLTGAKDDTPIEQQRMRRRELRWINSSDAIVELSADAGNDLDGKPGQSL